MHTRLPLLLCTPFNSARQTRTHTRAYKHAHILYDVYIHMKTLLHLKLKPHHNFRDSPLTHTLHTVPYTLLTACLGHSHSQKLRQKVSAQSSMRVKPHAQYVFLQANVNTHTVCVPAGQCQHPVRQSHTICVPAHPRNMCA